MTTNGPIKIVSPKPNATNTSGSTIPTYRTVIGRAKNATPAVRSVGYATAADRHCAGDGSAVARYSASSRYTDAFGAAVAGA